MIYKAPKS